MFDTLESIMSIVSLTPSMMPLCSSEIYLRISGLIYYFVSTTGAVFRFFLKFLLFWESSTVLVLSIFEDTLLPLGKNFALLFKIDEFSYDIFTSFKLDNLIVGLVYSIYPSLLIFSWKSSIHPILWCGSFVSIFEIMFLSTGEILPGNCKFCVFNT